MNNKNIVSIKRCIEEHPDDRFIIVLEPKIVQKCISNKSLRIDGYGKPIDMRHTIIACKNKNSKDDILISNSGILGMMLLNKNMIITKSWFKYCIGNYNSVLKDYIIITTNSIRNSVDYQCRNATPMPDGVPAYCLDYTKDDVGMFVKENNINVDSNTHKAVWDNSQNFTGGYSVFTFLTMLCQCGEVYLTGGLFYRSIYSHPLNISKEVYVLKDNFHKTDKQQETDRKRIASIPHRRVMYNPDRLPLGYEVKCDDKGYLLVKCYNHLCGKFFRPSQIQLSSCLSSQNGGSGNSELYCSDACKKECPVFNKPIKSIIKADGFVGSSNRPITNAWVREQVLQRDNFKCSRCGVDDDLHVHHIIGATRCPMQADDIDNMITLCEQCHRELHTQEGCTYSDYRI